MLAKRIIPCLDILDGRVVKGVNFQNLVDAGDPVELAVYYDHSQADELVFLDITATNQKRKIILHLVELLARKIFIPFTIGGGIASLKQMIELVQAGADKVSLNSFALQNPEIITQGSLSLGSQCIVLGVDAKRVGSAWHVFSHAGKIDTGRDVFEWIMEGQDRGAGEVLLTSMDRDGTKSGFDLELTEKVSDMLSIPLIASGGVGELEHFAEAFLVGKADAALAASVFHQKTFTIKETKEYLAKQSIPVRLFET